MYLMTHLLGRVVADEEYPGVVETRAEGKADEPLCIAARRGNGGGASGRAGIIVSPRGGQGDISLAAPHCADGQIWRNKTGCGWYHACGEGAGWPRGWAEGPKSSRGKSCCAKDGLSRGVWVWSSPRETEVSLGYRQLSAKPSAAVRESPLDEAGHEHAERIAVCFPVGCSLRRSPWVRFREHNILHVCNW